MASQVLLASLQRSQSAYNAWSVSGSSAFGTLTLPGCQVVGWIGEILPLSPKMDSPAAATSLRPGHGRVLRHQHASRHQHANRCRHAGRMRNRRCPAGRTGRDTGPAVSWSGR